MVENEKDVNSRWFDSVANISQSYEKDMEAHTNIITKYNYGMSK